MPRSNSQIAPIHVLLVVIGAVALLVNAGGQYFRKPIVPKETEVFFSPKGGCTDAVVNEIRRATRSVLVQAYSFTSAPIAKALVDAHQRGLDVKIILDKSILSEHYSEGDFTAHAGIPTWVDKRHAIAHNKVMIIDGDTVITGSFNFTKQAEESNAENLLIIHKTPELAELYAKNWREHQGHSETYTGR
jgi:phosphatidylserine/phosphatidylglycerophosphate/cardiolipin synthase-like enzyme